MRIHALLLAGTTVVLGFIANLRGPRYAFPRKQTYTRYQGAKAAPNNLCLCTINFSRNSLKNSPSYYS